jgi:hypothetical protein
VERNGSGRFQVLCPHSTVGNTETRDVSAVRVACVLAEGTEHFGGL